MLNDILQFAHVALQWLDGKQVQRCGADAFVQAEFLIVFLNKEVGQRDDILLPLAQRINQHGEYIETVVQIFAEQMLMNHVLEITVGGGNNAYINFDGYGAAHTGDLFFLNGAQQLCLESKGQFAHFVEKQCAILGCFPQAGFCLFVLAPVKDPFS